MPHIPQALPSGDTKTDDRARRLALLIGPSIQPADGTLVAADLLALGGLLAYGHDRIAAAVAEAHPGTATELLDELEDQYGLANGADLTTAARRIRLLAKVRARREGTENAILATVRTLVPTATIQGVAWSATTGYPRGTFRFAVVVPTATFDDSTQRGQVAAAAEQQKPAHTEARVTTRVGFRCDDPLSRCDDTLLAT